MILSKKTLEKLRDLITHETEYRSGPKLVEFFNALGSKDTYGQGFPSRWVYVDEKLSVLNGTPQLDSCIKHLFSPVNFIERFDILDSLISSFNQYLSFDGWSIVRTGKEISFAKASFVEPKIEKNEDDFLGQEIAEIPIDKLGLDPTISEILKIRLEEIKKCITTNAPLSVIFLCGSTLEGILLGFALKLPKEFNSSKSAPKKDNKVLEFQEWTLNSFIDVAHDLDFLKEDVKKYSHSLRDFRNYIHPYAQMSSKFNPDIQTAKISWHVLKAAIYQLSNIK